MQIQCLSLIVLLSLHYAKADIAKVCTIDSQLEVKYMLTHDEAMEQLTGSGFTTQQAEGLLRIFDDVVARHNNDYLRAVYQDLQFKITALEQEILNFRSSQKVFQYSFLDSVSGIENRLTQLKEAIPRHS